MQQQESGTARVLKSLCLSIACAACLAPGNSTAQTDAETLADLRACRSVERDRARLACFDGVFAAAEGVDDSSRTSQADTGDASRAPVQQVAASREPAEAQASSASPPQERIERQVASADPPPPQEDAARRIVTIVDLNADRPGGARFLTDTGRVLIQTSGGGNRRDYPSVPFEATLEEGTLGSQFLDYGGRRRIRVRIAD